MRGAAAHLWWAYYKALKKREGVIGGRDKASAVLNKIPASKRAAAARMAAGKLRTSRTKAAE
jgi:DNA-3-methyladenine glycosylase II